MSSLLGHRHGEKTHFSRNEKRTINSFTCPIVSLSIRPFVNLLACQLATRCNLFGKKFNIMGVFFSPIVHLAVKNRFSRGFVLMPKGVNM